MHKSISIQQNTVLNTQNYCNGCVSTRTIHKLRGFTRSHYAVAPQIGKVPLSLLARDCGGVEPFRKVRLNPGWLKLKRDLHQREKEQRRINGILGH